jgi:hypothetical protein
VARGAVRPGRGRTAWWARSAMTSRVLAARRRGGKVRADGAPGGVQGVLEADLPRWEVMSMSGVRDQLPDGLVDTEHGPPGPHAGQSPPNPLQTSYSSWSAHASRVPPADEEPASHSPAQHLSDRTQAALPKDSGGIGGLWNLHKAAVWRHRPSAKPDSTASQVSTGPDTTEPANASASAEAGKRAPHPSLTRRRQSQH